MKKILIVILICSLFITGCKDNQELQNNIGEIQNLTTSTKEIPKFTISIKGIKNDIITQDSINDLILYDFEVNVPTYYLDSNKEIKNEKWTGIKLKDILQTHEINNYNYIDFNGAGKVTIRYAKEEIDDNIYIVFYRNDVAISETESTPVMLIAPNQQNRYWVPALKSMNII